MLQPLISIIIPVYKVEPYLRRCLDSVISQTYTNLEIILVDDGSPDNCPQICDEYAAKDKRIVVIHKKNGGLSDARNVGTSVSKGEYIYYLDSDDELPLDSINYLMSYVKSNYSAEIIVGKMHCPQNEAMYKDQLFDYDYTFKNNIEFRKYVSSGFNIFPVNACNKLIKKDFVLKNNLFFKCGIIHEDELWGFLVSKVAQNVICVNKHTYIRHINPGSITTASSVDEKKRSWGIILSEIFSEINQPLFTEQFFKYYTFFSQLYPLSSEESTPLFKDIWKNCIHCAYRNNFKALALALTFHKLLRKVTYGHGTGFIIWFLCTRLYKK